MVESRGGGRLAATQRGAFLAVREFVLMENLPDWWNWELEFTSHLLKRMIDRGFNESDLRMMVEDARDVVAQDGGRYRLESTLHDESWIVIVEPDTADQVLLVVTAYPCG